MTKSGQRLIAAAKEARGIARGEIEPARMYIPADIDVRQTDRIEELEAKLEKAVEALEKLARLGNGDRYGNSDGNMIARATLEELNNTQEKRL